MEKATVTFTNLYEFNAKGERTGDECAEIAVLGYDESDAKFRALEALKYACCDDFSRPSSCRPGHAAEYFSAEGVVMGEDEDADDIADELGWDYACVFTFEGKKYAFPSDFDECPDAYGEIKSDDMRQRRHWPDPDGDYGPEEDDKD